MHRWLVVMLVLLGTACASVGGLRTEPIGAGVGRTFVAPLTVVLAATRDAIDGNRLELEEARQLDERTWSIIAKRTQQSWTWGELVRLIVREVDDKSTEVRILTKRRVALNITARDDWSQQFFDQIALSVATRRQ